MSFYKSRKTYLMYPSDDLMLVTPSSVKQDKKQNNQVPYIKTKLHDYVSKNKSAKDKRLLECHAHCFISLS